MDATDVEAIVNEKVATALRENEERREEGRRSDDRDVERGGMMEVQQPLAPMQLLT